MEFIPSGRGAFSVNNQFVLLNMEYIVMYFKWNN